MVNPSLRSPRQSKSAGRVEANLHKQSKAFRGKGMLQGKPKLKPLYDQGKW